MKALKFFVVAAIVSCSMIHLAAGDGIIQKKKVVTITFQRAIFNPGLAQAMYSQINPDFINTEEPGHLCRVLYQGNIYLISGTTSQWEDFFEQWKPHYKEKWRSKIATTAFGPQIM